MFRHSRLRMSRQHNSSDNPIAFTTTENNPSNIPLLQSLRRFYRMAGGIFLYVGMKPQGRSFPTFWQRLKKNCNTRERDSKTSGREIGSACHLHYHPIKKVPQKLCSTLHWNNKRSIISPLKNNLLCRPSMTEKLGRLSPRTF